MITREAALELLEAQGVDATLRTHCLMSEAVLRGLAAHLGEDPELWGLTGLPHDVDCPQTRDTPMQHGLRGQTLLAGHLPPEACAASATHNDAMNGSSPPSTLLDWALRCGESVTGLVAATALVRPARMEGMKPKSLKKKMKVRSFAANVDRDIIAECVHLQLVLATFLQIAIDTITPIADQVGLGVPAKEAP